MIIDNFSDAPKPPSVSVSPSGEIMEGSSVTLTCSSDANPAANYTWYKEDEDSPTASGQIFTITNITAEHGGKYQCEAQNTHGRSNTTLPLTVGAGAWKSAVTGTTTALLLVVILLTVFLWISSSNCLFLSSHLEETSPSHNSVSAVRDQKTERRFQLRHTHDQQSSTMRSTTPASASPRTGQMTSTPT
ncbi:limbic system-associated membrane protein isoform X8 [Pleuronectes platessa]|uniref:limbic system-associated membrane protein isoform X8 n=1 Tax=Pleuronectes platessa TaxID=8262 RepID=UPI00232A7466|nr:limbic system-associated membrane protein isoform X8 [Pleuronectes platessa]